MLSTIIRAAIRTRLILFMARDIANDDGNIRRYGPAVLATATAWPLAPELLATTLEAAGITVDGRLKHWHDLVGNPSREDRRRLVDRDRQRRHRAKPAEPVTRATVTSRDTGVTPTVTPARPYKEPARARLPEEKEKETHTGPDALRATPETPATITTSTNAITTPQAVAILETIWPGPIPARVTRLVVDRVHDAARWKRPLDPWAAAGWHIGPGAIRAILDRYDRDVDARRAEHAPSAGRPGRLPRQDAPAPPARHSPGTPPPDFVPSQRPPMTDDEYARSRQAFETAFQRFRATTPSPSTASPARTKPTLAQPTPDRPVPPFGDLATIPIVDRAEVFRRMLEAVGNARRASTGETVGRRSTFVAVT